MAQFYQIVGQGPSLTLEDLQRYCPNICLDGIIVNQDEQQYAQQQVSIDNSSLSTITAFIIKSAYLQLTFLNILYQSLCKKCLCSFPWTQVNLPAPILYNMINGLDKTNVFMKTRPVILFLNWLIVKFNFCCKSLFWFLLWFILLSQRHWFMLST